MTRIKVKLCRSEPRAIGNGCSECEKYWFIGLPSEDEIIEQLFYELEREADLM